MTGGLRVTRFSCFFDKKKEALSVKFALLESLTVSPREFDTFVFGSA